MMAMTSLHEMSRVLLNELQAGTAVQLEITAKDAETGRLLLLILALHEAAQQRQVGVVLDQVATDTIQLSIAGDA
jgi:hypothetical protein